MKVKKIVALAAALAQLCMFVPATQAASVSEDTVVYSYDYTQYTSADEVKAKGITIYTTNSYGTPVNSVTVGDKSGVWWIGSTRSTCFSSMTDITKVDIVSDATSTVEQSQDDVVVFDIDYGVRLSQNGYNEVAQLRFVGTNSDESEAALATFEMNIPKDKSTGTAYFTGSESVTVPYIGILSTATGQPGQRTNLRIAFDMKNKTYSAWYIKRSEHGASEASADEPSLLVHDVPMLCDETADAKYPSYMYFSIKNNAGSETFAPVSMTTTILSDATVIAAAKDVITVADTATEDIVLPSVYFGADITWTSDNTEVIAADGTVTRPLYGEGDATVNLTATIARGESSDTKTFEVTVPEVGYVPEESDNGIWSIDNMDYAASSDIPVSAEDSKHYFSIESLVEVADKENVDTANTELNGYAYADNGTVTLVRAGSVGTGGTYDATIKKYISSTPQHTNEDLVVEFEYERIGSPDVYIAVESLNNWRGPITMNNVAANTFSTYGQGSVSAKKTNKITILFNGEKKTFDTYLNGSLYKSGLSYRYTDDAYADISKVAFTVKADSAAGSGIAINYVRFMDKDAYSQWTFDNESELTLPETVDAYTTSVSLPSSGVNNNKITWTSSDESVITSGGAVTHGSEDKQVTMSAVYQNIVTGETMSAGEYVITVEKAGEFTAEVAQMDDIAPIDEAAVTVNAANATASVQPVDIYYVFYNADGTLNSVTLNSAVEVPVGKKAIETTVTVPENADELKVFVWSSAMKAYAKGGCNVTAAEDM